MTRRLLCLSLGFAAACAAAEYLLPPSLYLPMAGAAALLAALSLLLRGKTGERALLLLLGFALALFICRIHYTRVEKPALALAGKDCSMTLIAADYCEYKARDGWGSTQSCRIPVRVEGTHIRAYLYGDEEILSAVEPGQYLCTTATVTDATVIRGSEVRTFSSKNIYILLFAGDDLTVKSGTAGSLRYVPQRLCHRMQTVLHTLYEGETAALLLGLITGDSSALSTESRHALSGAGLSHIMAVSGLHCGFLLFLVRLITGRHYRRTTLAGLPVLTLYALLTGASPSIVRSVIMAGFLLLAPWLFRETDAPTSLGAALLVLLLRNPRAIASVSLQLSFLAVAGLLLIAEPLYRYLTKKRGGRVWSFVASSVSASLGALALTLPLSLLYFGEISLAAPLANLLCLLPASLTFSLALLSVLCGMVCLPLGALLALAARLGAEYILFAARTLAELPRSSLGFDGRFLLPWLLFYLLLLAVILLPQRSTRKSIIALSGMALTLLLACTLTAREGKTGTLNIYMLDVGQGASTLAVTEDSAVLIDCGSANSYIDAGEEAAELLSSLGIRKIDALVLSHAHRDHTDGLPTLLASVTVETLLLPSAEASGDDSESFWREILETADDYSIKVQYIDTDTTLDLSETAALRLLPPPESTSREDKNESCLTALLTAGDFAWLYSGDLGAAGEREIARTYALPDLSVLAVGHHGSRGSTDESVLQFLAPEAAVISVGSNSYGHPAAETLQRLEDGGIKIYRTDENGTVRIQIS